MPGLQTTMELLLFQWPRLQISLQSAAILRIWTSGREPEPRQLMYTGKSIQSNQVTGIVPPLLFPLMKLPESPAAAQPIPET